MRVLFVANTFPSPDKLNTGAFNLRGVQNLLKAGVDVKVVHFRSWSPKKKVISHYPIDGVEVTAIALPYFVGLSPRLLSANLWLYRKMFDGIFKKYFLKNTDIIHSVGVGHAGIICGFIARKYGIPHVAQCIGSDVNIILPQIAKFAGVKGWNKGVDIFVGNSKELRDHIHKLYPSSRAEVIYRGVNLHEFHPVQEPKNGQKNYITVTYLGGLSPKETKPFGMDQKGGITLLKAWEKFKQDNPASNASLQFCGPNVNSGIIASILQKDPSSIQVNVVGPMDRKKVASLLQQSQIVVLPSMFEGLPNVAMEAAASGAALVGTKVGGIPEVIMEGRNGYLIDRKDADQIADKLSQLINDQNILSSFQKESRRFMEERFDSRQFAEGYINIYKELTRK